MHEDQISPETRRLFIDIVANLAWHKRDLVERILSPAGADTRMCWRHLRRKDEQTGKSISKRFAAPYILEEMMSAGKGNEFLANVVGIAANWSSFELTEREYEARAVVEKAKDHMKSLDAMRLAQREELEKKHREAVQREREDRKQIFEKERKLLLAMFDNISAEVDRSKRGLLFEHFLPRLMQLYGIQTVGSFMRNDGAEQLDGAIKMEGASLLVECKWRQKRSEPSELDAFAMKINRSGSGTMGLFLSINGWSENVVPLLKQNGEKRILLAEGYEVRLALEGRISLREALEQKIDHLRFRAEPYLPVRAST